MEILFESQQPKSGRYRYFQMLINLGFMGPKVNLWIDIPSLSEVLTTTGFVSQLVLETTLSQLTIEERGRSIQLANFSAQLERDDLSGVPYWNIFLTTKSLTTPRSIARSVSQKLFQTTTSIDPTIKIHPTNRFEQLERENRFVIPNSDWYPGYFSQATLNLTALLEIEEVRESIKDTPEKYRSLINTLVKSAEREGEGIL